jgi:release factor glutamine methyltransferase
MPLTLSTLLTDATAALADASPTPRLDAELLLAHALGRERSYLHAHAGEAPDAAVQERFRTLTVARRRGEPIAYLTSKREFWSLELKVSPATLIPRHETELLVELALQRIPGDAQWELLDLGTGSGAIALAEHDPHLTQGDVRFEPLTALTAGSDGLNDLRRIVAAAPAHLESGGWLLLEHGHNQGAEVRELLVAHGYTGAATFRDLQGQERASVAMRTDVSAPR